MAGPWSVTPLIFAAVLSGCDPGIPEPTPRPRPVPGIGCEAVRFPATDGVEIEADWCPAPRPGAPLLLLVPMIPPHTDRTAWPTSTRTGWRDAGFAVLSIDRRGGGESSGDATESWRGPRGGNDLLGALRFAATVDPPVDLKRWACLGAGHGSTACLDQAAASAAEGLPPPAAMVWFSPGPDTSNHLSPDQPVAVPLLVVWGEGDRWGRAALAQRLGPAVRWLDVPQGGYGLRIFARSPALSGDVLSFLVEQVSP